MFVVREGDPIVESFFLCSAVSHIDIWVTLSSFPPLFFFKNSPPLKNIDGGKK